MSKKTTIAVKQTAVAEVLPPASAVELALKPYGIESYSYEACIGLGRQVVHAHKESGLVLGLVCIALKEREAPGRYIDAVEYLGLNERTARLYAARARAISQSGNVSALSASKLDKAIKLTGGNVAELLDEDGNIAGLSAAEIDGMKAAEFADVISRYTEALIESRAAEKVAQGKAVTWETKFETAEKKFDKLQAQLLHKAEISRLPEFAVTMRQEALAQCEQMDLCLEALDQVYREQLQPELDGVRGHYAVQAAGTYYHGLRGVLARVQATVQALGETFGDAVTGPFRQEFTLNKGELALARETYELVKQRHEALTHNKLVRGRRAKGARGRHGAEMEVR